MNEKTGERNPLFDYEKIIYRVLFQIKRLDRKEEDFKNRHVWIKKATGLGITEFILRIMLWLSVRNNNYKNCQMCVITGPKEDIAISLIKRMKRILEAVNIFAETKETVLRINGVDIEAFPSNHLASYRGLTAPKFIFLDEADFFRKESIQEVRDTTERYIAKSKPYIVMVSTPNKPDLLFQMIENEPEDACIYNRLMFDYKWGIGKMYTEEEIEMQKRSSSFPREYDLQYLGIIGNTFHSQDIDKAVELGEHYDPDRLVIGTEKRLGIDPGWGSSAFAMVLLQVADGMIQVLLAEEFERPRYEDMIGKVVRLMDSMQHDDLKIYVDASNPEFIGTLKREAEETDRWEYINEKILYCKKNNLDLSRYMQIIPVPFASEGKNMLIHAKEVLEYERPVIAINKKFNKLITSLRTAISDDLGKLDKEETSYDDVLDAFRLALKGVKLVKKTG